jgi:hypothetical protein
MTAVRVIEDYSELSGIGQVTPQQADAYFLQTAWIIVSGTAGPVPPDARKLVAGPGVTITDNGPGQDIIISANGVTTGSQISWVERPSGINNGINVDFTLAHSPLPGTALMFFIDGVLQEQGSDSDYILTGSSGNVVHVLFPYRSGSNIRATYPY